MAFPNDSKMLLALRAERCLNLSVAEDGNVILENRIGRGADLMSLPGSPGRSFGIVWVRNLRWYVVSVFGSMLAAMTFVIVNSFPW